MRRRDLLLGGGALAALGLPAVAGPQARRLVVVFADGGFDPTLTFDPKPGVDGIDGPYVDLDPSDPLDREEIGTWGDIDVTLNERRRPGVTRFFEEWGHRTTVVRGLWIGSVSHWIGRARVLCGTEAAGAPDLTAIVGQAASDRPLGMVDLSGVGRFGPASALGARGGERGQLRGLLLPETRFPLPDGSPRPRAVLSEGDRSAVEAWLQGRSVAEGARDPRRRTALDARTEARRRAGDLRHLGPALEPLLPAGQRDLQDQVALTIELLASGVCQAVLIDSAHAWDTHASHETQHDSFSGLFYGLRELARGLQGAGLLEDTVVVALSDMGRSPRRNWERGTDHWPYTGAVLLGSGIAGGRVCGATDEQLVGIPEPGGDLLRYDHLAAGLLDHLGLDPAGWLPGVRPFRGFVA